MAGLKALKRFSISSTTAWFLRTARYWAKSTSVGSSDSCWTLRLALSLRVLKACRDVTVWPRRPREVVTLAQSSLRAADRCVGEGTKLAQARCLLGCFGGWARRGKTCCRRASVPALGTYCIVGCSGGQLVAVVLTVAIFANDT